MAWEWPDNPLKPGLKNSIFFERSRSNPGTLLGHPTRLYGGVSGHSQKGINRLSAEFAHDVESPRQLGRDQCPLHGPAEGGGVEVRKKREQPVARQGKTYSLLEPHYFFLRLLLLRVIFTAVSMRIAESFFSTLFWVETSAG